MDKSSMLQRKLTALATGGKLCVAFSGGVDSALLVKLACDAGLEVHAVTFDSTLQSVGDSTAAAKQAAGYGAHHQVVFADPLAREEVRRNSRERCYFCKQELFLSLLSYAKAHGIEHVIDGTNQDDLGEYRPGLKALAELKICSPLAELEITKNDVREMAVQIGLDVAKRPSSPCLATRFPYGTLLTSEALRQCGEGEALLHSLGFSQIRLRVHGTLARIELPKEQFPSALEIADKIEAGLRMLGYQHITLDFAGYRSGCYDTEEIHGT